ncbi:MAG: multicopper oxidase domain-containing protein, partial [Chitinophagaceae bacterium]
MKKIIFIVLLMFAYDFADAQNKIIYTCPMHPKIQKEMPGKCPICGMALVKKTIKASVTKPVSANKDQHPVLRDTIPPKKNMNNMDMPVSGDSVKHQHNMQDTVPRKIKEGTQTSYTCPMHPEIHSPKPGNCPRCGMKLVPESKKETDMQMGNMPKVTDMGYKMVESNVPPRTVRYDLYIRDTIVTFGKKSKRAIAVNGQIPMPALTFTQGDTAEIYVHNELNEETSLHWHGLFLPNRMDGVPFLTQMPVKPHSTYLYKFPIVQHGTHWYHSHSKLQEQIGMYGAFIMNKRKEWSIPTIPVVLSEWTNMKPEEVHRSLRSATDWFAIQKKAT